MVVNPHVRSLGAGDSMTKKSEIVVTTENPSDQFPQPITNNRFSRSTYEKEWRAAVESEFRSAGLGDIADKWHECSDTQRQYWSKKLPPIGIIPQNTKALYVCSNEPSHQIECRFASCDNRLCPECARRHSARLLARYVPVMTKALHNGKQRFSIRQVVLTTDIHVSDPDLQAKIKLYASKVKPLFDRVIVNSKGNRISDWGKSQGMLFGFEFGEDGQHLHFHCLHYGQFLPQDKISEAWKALTGYSVVYVNAKARKNDPVEAIEGAVAETVKYTTKFWKVDVETGEKQYIEPKHVVHIHQALKGQRRFRSYGIFYNVPEPEKEPCTCKVCDSVMVRWKLIDYEIFLNTGFTPHEWDEFCEPDLNLKLANKSPPDKPEQEANSPPQIPVQDILPKFDSSILNCL